MKQFYSLVILTLCLFIGSSAFSQTEFYYEDFDGGLPDGWQALEVTGDGTPSANWTWTNTGPAGPFAGSTGPLESESAANGWMIFDSDLNCSQNQEAWLVSSAIDATGQNIVILNFQTVYARYNDLISVELSTDLTNWTSFPLFTDFTINEVSEDNPTEISIDISSVAANQSKLFIAFKFLSDSTTDQGGTSGVGCAYNWQIDDVRLLDADPSPHNDMSVSTEWFAIPPNFATPYSQVDPIRFMTDIENIGQDEQTGVLVNMEIINTQTLEVVFSSDYNYGAITADSLAENQIFPDSFTPSMDTAAYIGTYTVLQDQIDEVPENNSLSFSFLVSDTTFAKSNGQGLVGVSPGTEFWSYGNHYYIPNGEGFKATSCLFGIENSDVFVGELELGLYEWADSNNDSLSTESERIKIATSAPYIPLPGEDFITIKFVALDGSDDVLLKDDTHYLAIVHTKSFNTEVASLFATPDENFNYFPTTYATSGNNDWKERRFGSFFATGNDNQDLETREFSPSFNFAALARLHIQPVNPTSSIEEFSSDIFISTSPNPANRILELNLRSPEVLPNLKFELINMEGKLVHLKHYKNVLNLKDNFSVDFIPSGTYIARFQSENHVYNETIIIQH